jgi:ATP-dependent Clp protease ATP-binding subunit ClpA
LEVGTIFERYTEKARRVIFFARYEASQFGSPCIETEHFQLGILREDKALTNHFLCAHKRMEGIRKAIEKAGAVRESVSTSRRLWRALETPKIAEVRQRIRFIAHRHEEAVTNHEFDKARFYSGEERKERENLRNLEEKYGAAPSSESVTAADVEQVLARWSSYPYSQ